MSAICEVDLCKTPAQVANLCRIRPQDFDLSKCGVPQIPTAGARYVDLYKAYPFSLQLGAAGSGTDIFLDEKRSIDHNADFYLHRVTAKNPDGTPASGYYFRLQWPSGRYFNNQLQAIETLGGVMYVKNADGSTRVIRIPATQTIGIGLQNFGMAAVNVTLIFEGVSRFYLR